jgi:hypothetical protein
MLSRFAYDDLGAVRSVLRDLVHNGVVYRTGRGDQTTYRAATPEEMRMPLARSQEALGNMVWIAVQRAGAAGVQDLAHALSLEPPKIELALVELCARGLVEVEETASGTQYRSHGCVLAYDDPHGWEAAVFDHFQAMVIALCTKLRLGQTHATRSDTVGGSTFGFEVWPEHPEYENVLGLLGRLRAEGSELRRRVAAYNETHQAPAEQRRRVVAYVGQTVVDAESPSSALDNDADDED